MQRNISKVISSLVSLCSPLMLITFSLLVLIGMNSTSYATEFPVSTSAEFTQALLDVQPGDTILLQAGTTFVGHFTLPYIPGSYTEWITIRSSSPDSSLPPAGHRITPAYASAGVLPKIVSPGSNLTALDTASGAHHFRIIGVEIVAASVAQPGYMDDLIVLGSASEANAANLAHHLIIDRCYIHGDPNSGLKRGIALNSAHTDIINSQISDCHVVGADSQAIGGWNGPGPFRIINNRLEAAAENVLFGGAYASISGLIPSDIEIRLNLFTKPLAWRTTSPDPNNPNARWTVKNSLELKNARRVVIDNNIFENVWGETSNQYPAAIVFTPRVNESGDGAAVVEDVRFTNNLVRHVPTVFNIAGRDSFTPSAGTRTRRILIANNLGVDVNTSWAGDGRFLQILDGTQEITVDHNTVFHNGVIIEAEGTPHQQFIFRNNIVEHNDYGVHGADVGIGNAALATYFPNCIFRRNVIPGLGEYGNSNWSNTYSNFPDNFYLPYLDDVGFVNRPNGNYRLAPTSAQRNAGTDGNDVGCNIDALNVALQTTDFDGDRKTEIAVRHPGTSGWFILSSLDGSTRAHFFGTSGDVAVPGDYDGDRQTDYAVFRHSTGYWYVLKSSNPLTVTSQYFGVAGDTPMPRDYDADGKTDFAVFRPSNSTWYVIRSSDGVWINQVWGASGDVPVPGDFDGDGKADFAVFRPSTNGWYILNSFNNTTRTATWGASGDVPVPGDFDGDGRLDIAVFRPSDNTWYILKSSTGLQLAYVWGSTGDKLVPGDYDADSKTDPAIWRPSNGTWYIRQSSTGSQQSQTWGTSDYAPVSAAYLP